MNNGLSSLIVAATCMAAFSSTALAAPDWSKVPKTDVFMVHPAVTPVEWLTEKGGEHGGVNGLKKGTPCAGCHIEDGKLNLDLKRLASKDLEPKGAPKVMSFPVAVQAAYDASNLYMRLTFKAPAGGFDKSDKDNELKATVMFANDRVTKGEIFGCWATCHKDQRNMPGGDEKKSKWVAQGAFDLMQWRSGDGGQVADGTVTDKRSMSGGKAGVTAEASKSGDAYTVTFTRKLAGGVEMSPGKKVPFGIGIHADNSGGRFHHVSLEYTLGIGTDGDVKAVKQ